ncbi:MAG: hypothetical protein HKO79_03175 [Desulfobacterales bacterium]|nr:hypothetical protein [Deltaproteobacteria bacterium]NNL41468.1 hypothetical protein [Desulfobacterales bacterium]
MKIITFCLIFLLGTVSCTSLPKIGPVNLSTIPEIHRRCSDVFLEGKWQLDHLIEFAMPGNKKSFVRGITVISYEERKIESVIMTIEGFVFLDAYYDQKVIINRGIPPFDSIDFVRGMMDDIKLMFFKPETDPIESGISGDGEYICRYKNDAHSLMDVITTNGCNWEIRRYSPDGALVKTVKADQCRILPGSSPKIGFPGRIKLASRGIKRYALAFELKGAKRLKKN